VGGPTEPEDLDHGSTHTYVWVVFGLEDADGCLRRVLISTVTKASYECDVYALIIESDRGILSLLPRKCKTNVTSKLLANRRVRITN
jgi:hypothetical protein